MRENQINNNSTYQLDDDNTFSPKNQGNDTENHNNDLMPIFEDLEEQDKEEIGKTIKRRQEPRQGQIETEAINNLKIDDDQKDQIPRVEEEQEEHDKEQNIEEDEEREQIKQST